MRQQKNKQTRSFTIAYSLFTIYYWLLPIACSLLFCGCHSKEKIPGKFFCYNQSTGLASLDPAFARDQSIIWPCSQLYNSLVQLDDSLNIRPCIASSWEISEDGKTYLFHLRRDVYFHDDACFTNAKGRSVNATDVVYSFKRIMDPHMASPGAWIFNNNVDSTGAFVAVNDSTFQLKLRKAYRPMLGILSMQYCSIIPREAVEYYGSGFRAHPVGTGPFKFKAWLEGVALILLKNENYFESDEKGNKLPYLDGIKVSFIDNKKTEYLSFRQHELDFINSIDASFVDEILDDNGNLKPELKQQFNLQKSPYLNTEYFGFLVGPSAGSSMAKEDTVWLNKKLRQAINYGVDRGELLKYLRRNVGRPAESGFTPYGLPSFNTDEVHGYHYDPDKAKQLLKEAGYENGNGLSPLKLYTNDTYKEFGLFACRQWEKLGLKIKVEIVQPAILREWMSQGKADFFRGSWIADYPDAENYFAVFYSKNGSPPNYTRFNNAGYDSLYEQALVEADNEKRTQLYHQLDRIIIEEAPIVPLYYDEALRFVQKNIKGLHPDAMNQLNLKKVEKQ